MATSARAAWAAAATGRSAGAGASPVRRVPWVPLALTVAAVPRRLPRPAPPAAPAAHHRHGGLDLQRLLPVRLVDPLAAVVARARRGPALHHLPARPARRERDVEHPRPRAGRAVRAGHAHRGPGRGLQRRDDPRPGRVRARARLALGAWVERWWPRAAAGLLYGFSPFVVAHSSVGHLNLVWAVLPPALLWLLHTLLVAPRPRPWRTGVLVGLASWCRPGSTRRRRAHRRRARRRWR